MLSPSSKIMAPTSLLLVSSLALILCSSIAQSTLDTETYSPSERQKERYEEGDNPYVFDRQSFRTRSSSRAGEIKMLPNFRQRSELLRGLEKYMISYIEMRANSMMKPLCLDADWVLVVEEGSGCIAYVQENNNLVQRRLEEGDVFVVPSGKIFYLINDNDKQTLRLINLIYTVSTPGRYEQFYMAGGRNPESVFSGLSREVLEAAFDSKEGVERMVSGGEEEEEERQGIVIHLRKEELERIMKGQSTRESMPAAHEQSPFNIFNHRPMFQNNHGKLIEADAREHAELGLLNMAVGIAVLHPGSMMLPNFNTRAIKIAIVLSGEGTMEMACPHLAGGGRSEGQGQYQEKEEEEQQISYKKVRATLRKGTAFVVPTAHPNTEIASSGTPLRILCFDINAQGNRRQFLAGTNSALKALDRRVVGKSFGISPEDIGQILDAQKDQVIVKGPRSMNMSRSMEEGIMR